MQKLGVLLTECRAMVVQSKEYQARRAVRNFSVLATECRAMAMQTKEQVV